MKEFRHTSSTIREALPFVALSDIPSQHKSVLMEVIARALHATEEDERAAAARGDGGPWQPEELKTIAAYFDGKIAANWQHADELVIRLAARLNRSPAEIKTKAKELGFGVGVDYRLARDSVVREEP